MIGMWLHHVLARLILTLELSQLCTSVAFAMQMMTDFEHDRAARRPIGQIGARRSTRCRSEIFFSGDTQLSRRLLTSIDHAQESLEGSSQTISFCFCRYLAR